MMPVDGMRSHGWGRGLRGLVAAGCAMLSWSGAAWAVEEEPIAAQAVVGQAAPAFMATDTHGQRVESSAWQGKIVVLEWFNPECPFVKKHYGSGNMQRLQHAYTQQGLVWISINSSAPGKQGSLTPDQANAWAQQQGAAPTSILLDPEGALGKRFGAKTTPHLFVIDGAGVVRYQGAIDDHPSTDQADVAGAVNYAAQALDALLAGQPVAVSSEPSYGCSVKY